MTLLADIGIGVGMELFGDLFGDDDTPDNTGNINASGEWSVKAADIMAKKAYPGQKDLATNLAPYLWENLDVGLTGQEKQEFRGMGRTAVDTSIRGQRRGVKTNAATQGLRGGTIADMVAGVNSQQTPAYAGLETNISALDQQVKKKRMDDILKFLSLNTYGEGGTSSETGNSTPAPLSAFDQVLADIGYIGGGGGGVGGDGLGGASDWEGNESIGMAGYGDYDMGSFDGFDWADGGDWEGGDWEGGGYGGGWEGGGWEGGGGYF